MDVFGVQKKLYMLSKLGGGRGGRYNLDKIQKLSNFFFVRPSLTATKPLDWIGLKFGDGVID